MTKELFILLISCLFFTACKKGKDDPGLSLLSRKARLAGEWKLQSGRITLQTMYPAPDVEVVDFALSRSSVTFTVYAANSSTVRTGPYKLNLSVAKDGSFSFIEQFGSTTLNAKGTWAFNAGTGDLEKKAEVFFIIADAHGGSTSGLQLFNKSGTNFDYHIRELRNKRLVLETSAYVFLNAKGEFQGIEGKYIFSQ